MPTINTDIAVWAYKKPTRKNKLVKFQVEIPENWYITLLWALIGNDWRDHFNLMASQTSISGFWMFYWEILMENILYTCKKGLEEGYITQEEFDKAYPDPDNPLI